MATIGNLSARILADSSGVTRGIAATKDQLKIARQAFIDSRTDVEKYGAALDKLKEAKDAGAFAGDPSDYTRALAALQAHLDPVTIRQNQLRTAIGSTVTELKEQIRTVGMSADELQVYSLQLVGATEKTTAAIRALQAQRNALQEQAESVTRAKQQVAGLDRPWKDYRDRVRDLEAAERTGAITKGEYTAGLRHVRGELYGQIPVIGGLLKSYSQMSHGMFAFQAATKLMAAGLGGITVVAGISAHAIGQALSRMREVERQAGKVGMGVEDFVSLSRGAELANVSSEALTNGLLEVQKKLAQMGHAAIAANPTEQLMAALHAVRQWPTAAQQAAATMEAFGDAGKELLPIVRMTAAEYAAWQRSIRESKPMGLDQAGAIRAADLAVKQLKFAWEDLGVTMAGKVAPYIQTVAEAMRQWLADEEHIASLTSALDVLAGAVQGVMSFALGAASTFGEWDESTDGLVSEVALVSGALAGMATVGGSAIAVSGQLVIGYRTLQTMAAGARVALVRLNSAVGVGYVAAVGAAAIAGYALGTMLVNQTQWAKDAAKAYEEYSAGVKSLHSREAKQREDTLAAIQAAPQGQRMAMAQAEMEMAQKQLDGLTARAEMAKEEMDRLAPSWLSAGQAGKKVWEAQAAEYEELKARAAEAGRWVNTLEDTLRGGGQRAALTPTVATPTAQAGMPGATAGGKTLQQETAETIAGLQQQMREVGKTADQVALLRLQARGLGPEWLAVVEQMQQRLGAGQQAAEARTEVERLNSSLREQIATARMAAAGWSTEQIEAWKLAQRGAGQEQLRQLAMLQQAAAAAKAQQDAQTAAVDRQKALQTSLQETTRRLQEQIATAGMSAEQIERWKLAQQGATPQQLAQVAGLQQQAKGLQQQAKGLQEVSRETRIASADTGGWTAATRGSSEALERIAAYRLAQAATPANWVGPRVVNEGPPQRRGKTGTSEPAAGPAGSPQDLLAQAVQLLQRIVAASEGEKIVVEQTA